MNSTPDRPPVQVGTPAAVLAVVPHLLGFVPEASLVVIGAGPPRDRVQVAIRYDLPDPPDPGIAAEMAAHVVGVLTRHRITSAIVAGYGPGSLVTPLVDAIRAAADGTGLDLREILRAENSRYWSYLCRNPSCCPADGVPFDAAAHPAGTALSVASGQPVLADRTALAATIATLTGTQAAAMAEETRRAERMAARLITRAGKCALTEKGLAVVRVAIRAYRNGGSITRFDRHAWLALALTNVRIRDDAWVRMDPQHRWDHRRLWTDLVRRAQPGYVAAPASLLAFTAWQCGDGALANIALDRALADDPRYSMALLIGEALAAGVPPSKAVVSMTPDELTASYGDPAGDQPGACADPPDAAPGTTGED